jgi:hypothetical protein
MCSSSSKWKWRLTFFLSIFKVASFIRKLRFSVVLFCGWKRFKMLFFFFCLIVGNICSGRMWRKMFVLFGVLDRLFLSSWLLDSYTSIFFLCSNWSRSYSNVDTFFFTKDKDEIRNLSSSKSCRCLQAQWWKVKSLLDRWNLPSGYVSSMESNCWTSENFLSVD